MVVTPVPPHTGDNNTVGNIEAGQFRFRQCDRHFRAFRYIGSAQGAAVYADKARTEALEATHVFIAGALVDTALASEIGFHRHYRQAIRLHTAIAATFADCLVDEWAYSRIHHFAAFAAPALLRRTGLVIYQYGDTFGLA